MNRYIVAYCLFCLLFLTPLQLFAAREVNLASQSVAFLKSLKPLPKKTLATQPIAIEETSHETDQTGMVHIRTKETYQGIEVLGADAIIHSNNKSNSLAATSDDSAVSGRIYLELQKDLSTISSAALTITQSQKILQQVISLYRQKTNSKNEITETKSELKIYVTADGIAHYIYRVSFFDSDAVTRPVYLIDADNFNVYEIYDEIVSVEVDGGAYGGNTKTGIYTYDGMQGHYPSVKIFRDDLNQKCYLQNDDIEVIDLRKNSVSYFSCVSPDATHNNIYWGGTFDQTNSAFSPAMDIFFGASMTKQMLKEWYGFSMTMPELLIHNSHRDKRNQDNAHWISSTQISFEDGYVMFYPLASLDVVAHELAHGITMKYSKLVPNLGEAGAINESFSDMAAQAAELYFYGKSTWQIAEEVMRAPNQALRYMNQPSLDCKRGRPCSIDNASQYYNGMNVHYSCGVYNHFFHLLATTPGWDAKKAFNLMMQAQHYWTSYTGFNCAARGVINAAQQLGDEYDIAAIKKAFDGVKVKYNLC